MSISDAPIDRDKYQPTVHDVTSDDSSVSSSYHTARETPFSPQTIEQLNHHNLLQCAVTVNPRTKRFWVVGVNGLKREITLSPGCSNERAYAVLEKAGADLCGASLIEGYLIMYTDTHPDIRVLVERRSFIDQLATFTPINIYCLVNENVAAEDTAQHNPVAGSAVEVRALNLSHVQDDNGNLADNPRRNHVQDDNANLADNPRRNHVEAVEEEGVSPQFIPLRSGLTF